jgi:tRNA-(MS[2]IO[6]A)-hydroxylase (MiaE)-like
MSERQGGIDDRVGGVPPERRQAVIDLLGVLAYGELTAFDRLAADSRFAPTLDGRIALAAMAAAEIDHFEVLRARLDSMGVVPAQAMVPFIRALDDFHDSTRPSSWLESLVKAYVGDGIAADFYRAVAARLDPSTRELVLSVLEDTGHAEFAVREVRAAIAADGRVASRLSLWARRLVGEALSQAQRVAADRDALTELVIGGSADLGGLLKELTDAHTGRMRRLGLSS